MTFDTVKNGNELNKIPLTTFDIFFKQWVNNKRVQKIDLNIHDLYRDSVFTYFGKYKIGLFRSIPTFFKIYTDTLTRQFPNYSNFYGSELEQFLWDKIIPIEDRKVWEENISIKSNQARSICSTRKNRPKFIYLLADKKVILNMTWDIECNELMKLKDKKYQATYNLTTRQFEK